MVAVDFFVVPTLTFHLLFGFLVLRHHRRELVHVNVTDHPTAAWAAHQLVESFPDETAPTYLLRDRDAIYGDVFALPGSVSWPWISDAARLSFLAADRMLQSESDSRTTFLAKDRVA